MRYLFLTFILGFGFNCFSQGTATDTIFLKNGEMYFGRFVMEAVTDYKFVIGNEKTVSSFFKNEVKRIVKGDGTVYWDVEQSIQQKKELQAFEWSVDNENLLQRFKEVNNRIKQSGIYKEQAGKWGISASVMFLSGTVMALAGAFTGITELSYTGAGIGGAGIVFLIPTFVKVKESGTVLRERNSK